MAVVRSFVRRCTRSPAAAALLARMLASAAGAMLGDAIVNAISDGGSGPSWSKKRADELVKASSTQISQPCVDAWWVSHVHGSWGTWSGEVMSCFFHPTNVHSATTKGRLGTKKSEAAGGTWACSVQTRAMWGNKAHYSGCYP